MAVAPENCAGGTALGLKVVPATGQRLRVPQSPLWYQRLQGPEVL